MKKQKKILLGLAAFLVTANLGGEIVHSSHSMDTGKIDRGVIRLSLDNPKKLKLLISKDGKSLSYDYEKGSYYPLQMGNGKYTIDIWEQVINTRYKKIGTKQVDLKLKDPNLVYLESISMVQWNPNMEAIKKAQELTQGAKTQGEKLERIYNFVGKNIVYDFKKSNDLAKDYKVDIDKVYQDKSGICYDYASLNGAMLRSVGIPTRLVMGYKFDIKEYHAWNQVYIDGAWKIVDTTYDSAYIQKNRKVARFKDPKGYIVEKIY